MNPQANVNMGFVERPHVHGDPLFTGVQPHSANHSPLMRALSTAADRSEVNACPFDCGVDKLDDKGYCRHVVGFTTREMWEDGRKYEPVVRRGRSMKVQVRRERTPAGEDEFGATIYDEGPPEFAVGLDTDQLVRVTSSYRVYRDVDDSVLDKATRPAGLGVAR